MSYELSNFESCIEKITYGNKIQRNEYLNEGTFPIVSQEAGLVSGYWDNANDVFAVDKPVVIFGDHTRVIKYIDFSFVLGADGTKILKPKSNLDSKFFYYYLLANPIKGKGYARHYRFLKELFVPVPPLATQQKIVAKLDAVFAEIDKATAAAEANAKNAEALFQSYLTQVFERGGDDWITKSLKELASEDCTLSYGIVQPGDDFENGLAIVRPTNLTKKYIFKDDLKAINPKLADSYKRTTLTGEELLLCVRGTTGKVSLSTKELEGCNVTRGIVPIRFNNDEIDLDCAYYLFNSSVIQKKIKSKTYGAALLQINIADIKKLKITLPKISEQKKIVNKLYLVKTDLDKFFNSQIFKIMNLKNLKQSILKQAFNGELVKE